MTSSNVDTAPRELALLLYASLARGDRDSVLKVLHPDFDGHVTPGMPAGLGGDYPSPGLMQQDFWWQVGRLWRAEARPAELHLLDDGRLFVAGTYRGDGRRSGTPLEAEFVHVLTIREGLIAGLRQLTDSAAWAAALGEAGPLETIQYDVRDGLAHVRLDRPEVRNAIDLRMARDTLAVARRIESDATVRAVLISGNGRALSVGGDIAEFAAADGRLGELFKEMTTPFHEAFRILSRIDAPIVTAAHGVVAGGGLGYVYAADITLAAEGTRFVTAFADLAVSGDGGGSWHLPRRVGAARAAQIVLENRPVTAEEAVAWGLVNEVVPADELQERAEALATRLAAGPTRAFGRTRHLLRESWTNDLSEQLRAETENVSSCGSTYDTTEAVTAFLEKRPARFEGR
jgi:2-(1,2-epoxy-1,2-dihydrophenyl)acetyl-CoA isomerase